MARSTKIFFVTILHIFNLKIEKALRYEYFVKPTQKVRLFANPTVRNVMSYRLFLCACISLHQIWRVERESRAHNIGRESFFPRCNPGNPFEDYPDWPTYKVQITKFQRTTCLRGPFNISVGNHSSLKSPCRGIFVNKRTFAFLSRLDL